MGYAVIMQGIYMQVDYELSVAYWRHIGSKFLVNFDPGGGFSPEIVLAHCRMDHWDILLAIQKRNI